MAEEISKKVQTLVEKELRKGASNSRIANLLDLPYSEAVEVIEQIKENLRPEIGDEIIFTFRGEHMKGIIEKLLTNSAVVQVYWNESSNEMIDLIEEKDGQLFAYEFKLNPKKKTKLPLSRPSS